MYSTGTTCNVSVSSSDRDTMASNNQLPSVINHRRKPQLKRRILATIPVNGELRVRKRGRRFGSAHPGYDEHEFNHVLWPPGEPCMGSTTLSTTTNAIDVLRQHRRATRAISRSRPWNSARVRAANLSLPLPEQHRHKSINIAHHHHGRIDLRASLSTSASVTPVLPTNLELL